MFEKEAEEYTNNLLKDVNCNIGNPRARQINSIDVENAFQDGAEFGYNKANEWHYIKNGDLPKRNTLNLVMLENGRFKTTVYQDDFYIWSSAHEAYIKQHHIVAWKEITPPKENE